MPAPPMPFVPEDHHGQLIVMAIMAYAGHAEAGERAMAPFRALATPIADMVRPMPYYETYPPDEESYLPIAAARTMFVDAVDRSAAETIVDRLQASTAAMAVAQLRVLGGAMGRIPDEATAFAHRGRRIMVNLAASTSFPRMQPLMKHGSQTSRRRSVEVMRAGTSTFSATKAWRAYARPTPDQPGTV